MARHHILTNPDRQPCTIPGCSFPRTLAQRYVKRDGTAVSLYRKVCSWHTRHPPTAPHPFTVDVPRCQFPGCRAKARALQPDPFGNPRFARVCSNHPLHGVPAAQNPHVAKALAQLSRADRKAAGVVYDPKKKTYVLAPRPRRRAPAPQTEKKRKKKKGASAP